MVATLVGFLTIVTVSSDLEPLIWAMILLAFGLAIATEQDQSHRNPWSRSEALGSEPRRAPQIELPARTHDHWQHFERHGCSR